MSGGSGLLRRTRWSATSIARLSFVLSLLIAVAVTAGTGVVLERNLAPTPAGTIRVGESIDVAGVRYTVDRFDSVPELPNVEPGQPPVRGPEGSALVVLVFTVQVIDPDVDPELVLCNAEVHRDDTIWRADGDLFGYGGVPDHRGCGLPEPEEEGGPEWPRDKPFQSTALFVLPADQIEGLTAHLQVTEDPTDPEAFAYREVLVEP